MSILKLSKKESEFLRLNEWGGEFLNSENTPKVVITLTTKGFYRVSTSTHAKSYNLTEKGRDIRSALLCLDHYRVSL